MALVALSVVEQRLDAVRAVLAGATEFVSASVSREVGSGHPSCVAGIRGRGEVDPDEAAAQADRGPHGALGTHDQPDPARARSAEPGPRNTEVCVGRCSATTTFFDRLPASRPNCVERVVALTSKSKVFGRTKPPTDVPPGRGVDVVAELDE